MRTPFKILTAVVGGLVSVIVLSVAGVYLASEARINKTYSVQPTPIDIPTDSASVAEGRRLFTVRGCVDCHGEDLGGKVFIDNEAGRLAAANLTHGAGGVAGVYANVDWVRAIRHGIGPDGKPLLVMPSAEFRNLNDTDVGNLIAYIKSAPPVDRVPPQPQISLLFRGLFVAGQVPLVSAENIDHTAPVVTQPPSVSVEYGKYLAASCTGCHQTNFAGGPIPGRPDTSPKSANLTPAGRLGMWSEADFIRTLRTGVRPDGHAINNEDMPWQAFAQFKEDELKAIWLYLQSLPAVNPDSNQAAAS